MLWSDKSTIKNLLPFLFSLPLELFEGGEGDTPAPLLLLYLITFVAVRSTRYPTLHCKQVYPLHYLRFPALYLPKGGNCSMLNW